ncbi:hypothetical protein [Kordia jejudonensis]|uniref:hypothetical protein n=1 Tax=Kordia jejudonensis TaxID=1348245 RepID=UPI000629362F|nr:hypothetical protein [Kordia jejudonensis]
MKKILGYIFIGIGGFLGVSILLQLPTIFNDTVKESDLETSYGIGYVLGKVVAMFIIITILIFLIWLGRKWTKSTSTLKELDANKKETNE